MSAYTKNRIIFIYIPLPWTLNCKRNLKIESKMYKLLISIEYKAYRIDFFFVKRETENFVQYQNLFSAYNILFYQQLVSIFHEKSIIKKSKNFPHFFDQHIGSITLQYVAKKFCFSKFSKYKHCINIILGKYIHKRISLKCGLYFVYEKHLV